MRSHTDRVAISFLPARRTERFARAVACVCAVAVDRLQRLFQRRSSAQFAHYCSDLICIASETQRGPPRPSSLLRARGRRWHTRHEQSGQGSSNRATGGVAERREADESEREAETEGPSERGAADSSAIVCRTRTAAPRLPPLIPSPELHAGRHARAPAEDRRAGG